MKLPSFQFYPADWRKDPAVQSLSYHDRGIWFEIICLMHESEQRGKLLLNGKPIPEDALARLLGVDKQILDRTLFTLLTFGVATKCEETGALMNKRMVRDEYIRKVRSEAGKQGAPFGKFGGRPKQTAKTANQTAKEALDGGQNNPPSSSSSSSTSVIDAPHSPRVIPNWENVKCEAVKMGLAEWKARDWFDEMEGVQWIDRHHRPIGRWQSIIARVKTQWESDGRPMQKQGYNNGKGNNSNCGGSNKLVENIKAKRFEV